MRIALLCLLALVVVAAASPATSHADDGGWTKIYDHPVGTAKAIRMFDDDHGLAIIGTGIELATDGGVTWTTTDTTEIGSGRIEIADRQHAWIAGASAMLHTGDGGLTWQRQQTGTSAAPFNGISVVNANEVWATAYDAPVQGYPPHGSSALLHTVDGGVSWQSTDVPGYGIFLGAWFVGADGWLLATRCHPGDPTDPASTDPPPCVDQDTLLHTANGGQSWSALPEPAGGLGDQIARVDTLMAYRVGRVAYVRGLCEEGCAGPRLFKTVDRGQTWASVLADLGPNDGIDSLRFSGPLDGWLSVTQLQPPTNPPSAPDFRRRLAHTRDGGRSWTFVDFPDLAADAFDVTSTHVVTTAGVGGIVLYDIEQGTWQQAVTDARPALESIMFVTRERGYAVADSGDSHGTRDPWVTDDGGASWQPWVTPEHLRVTTVTSDAVWATGDRSLYRSGDDGASWREFPLPPDVDPKKGFRVQASAGDRVWLAAGVSLWRSEDGGATWRVLTVAPSQDYRYIDAEHGWTAQCGPTPCRNEIRITADGGDTWETRSVPTGLSVEGFTTPLDGWGRAADRVGGGGAVPSITHDGGVTWLSRSAPKALIAALTFVDADRWFAVTYDNVAPYNFHIFSTTDGGANWTHDTDVDRALGIPVPAVSQGRIWVTFTSNDTGSDIMGPPNRVTTYRKDFDPPPAPAVVSGEAPSHRKPLLVALLAGLALAGTLAATAIVRRMFR